MASSFNGMGLNLGNLARLSNAESWSISAASSDEVRQMMQVSAETRKFVCVGFKKMFFPANEKAKALISQAEFGRMTSITARYPQTLPPFRTGTIYTKCAASWTMLSIRIRS